MKYIFQSWNNLEIRRVISETGITVNIDLYKERSREEMWSIYDDKNNTISYYNSISKERNSSCKIIRIENNEDALIIMVALLARIRGIVSLAIDKGVIASYRKFNKADGFDALLEGSSFDKPFTVNMMDQYHSENFSSLMNGELKDDYNIGFIAISASEDYGVGDDAMEIMDCNAIRMVDCNYYALKDEDILLGCPFKEFIDGLKELDISKAIKVWLAGGKASETLFDIHNQEMGTFAYLPDDNGYLQYVILRHGKHSITIKKSDFINAIDMPRKVLQNMLGRMRNGDSYQHGANFDIIMSNDSDELFRCPTRITPHKLAYLPNIIDFKFAKFNLLDGTCS